MVENLSRKLIGIGLLVALTFWSLSTFAVNLGLDLQGGARIVYRLDFDKAVADHDLQNIEDEKLRMRNKMITESDVPGGGLGNLVGP